MINKKVFSETKNKLIKINIVVVSSFLIIFSLFTYFYFLLKFKAIVYIFLPIFIRHISRYIIGISVFIPCSSFAIFTPLIIKVWRCTASTVNVEWWSCYSLLVFLLFSLISQLHLCRIPLHTYFQFCILCISPNLYRNMQHLHLLTVPGSFS